MEDLSDSLEGTGPTKPLKAVPDHSEEKPAPEKDFASYMQNPAEKNPAESAATKAPSPFDIASEQGQKAAAGSSPETVMGQMKSTSGVLGDLQQQLQTKNLKLKPSHKYLLRNKLSESNNHIRSAASKLGVKVGEPPTTLSRQNPVARFLSLVNDGQVQLQAAQQKLMTLNKTGKAEPGQLLMVQVKLSKAQQELEYSSVLLSKAVEDVKTLFNIQI